jgi:hypothetical protein
MRDEEKERAGLNGSAFAFLKGENLMSATQTQTTPAHIIILDSKPFNSEVRERDIQELKDYAEQEQFDLETECRNLYGVPVEWVTKEQCSDLLLQAVRHRRKRFEQSGFHHHRCVDCGEVSGCLEPDCKKTEETECRVCHEGMSQSEWTMYHRKAAQEGWL